MWESLARYEWLLIGLLVIGLAGLELVSVNRSLRRDRQEKPPPGRPANPSGDPPPPGD